MKLLWRALPYILFGAVLYTSWYFWQQRPTSPLAAELLRLDTEEVEQVFIRPARAPEFRFERVEQGWLVSSGHNHLLEVSQRPAVLLQALVSLHSIDLAPEPRTIDFITQVELLLTDQTAISFDLFEAPDSVDYHNIIRFGEQPDYFALKDFNTQNLPLAFADYRSYELLQLSNWTSLDSLKWQGADSSRTSLDWMQPDSSRQLDSIKSRWATLTGRDFADYFDEIGDEPDWYGSYRFYGGQDSIDLKVYFDSLWPQPFVVYSTQFPKHYFALDSLPLPLHEEVPSGIE